MRHGRNWESVLHQMATGMLRLIILHWLWWTGRSEWPLLDSMTNAAFSLKNVVLWKLNYPLVMTTLSWLQCQKIMAPLLQQGLPKAGVVRSFPQAIVHGLLEYDIPHLYTEQLIMHLKMVLRYGPNKDDPTGVLLHATGKAMHLEVGYSGELLVAPISWLVMSWTLGSSTFG